MMGGIRLDPNHILPHLDQKNWKRGWKDIQKANSIRNR